MYYVPDALINVYTYNLNINNPAWQESQLLVLQMGTGDPEKFPRDPIASMC